MAESLKLQIANLQRKLAKVDLNASNVRSANNNASSSTKSRRKRRNTRNLRDVNFRPNNGYIAPRVQNTNPKAMVGKSKGIPPTGTIRIRRRELFISAMKKDVGQVWLLSATNFPWLKNLAASFDRIKWHSCLLIWRSAVATSTAGQIMMGVDWDSNTKALDATKMSTLTPLYEAPVWQSGNLRLPSSRLMTRKEYFIRKNTATDDADTGPGFLCFLSSAENAGHLWVEYDVTLFGTTSA